MIKTKFLFILGNQKSGAVKREFKPDLNAIENHVHDRLTKHNPLLLPYAREIEKDLQLILLYMKLKKMSGRSSNESHLAGVSTNRDEFARGFYSFLLFCRDILARYEAEYPRVARQIKNDCAGALGRLGGFKKRQN